MSDPITISSLEIENVKRVKAVSLTPSPKGLTVIGGRNNQGKTSVLDAIAWALGGDKYKPSEPRRDGSTLPPSLHIELSNGLVVERSGKNSDLKVIDPSGNKAGQTLLNSFIEQLALDLPKFLNSSSKEKAQTLLQIIGVGDQLFALQASEQRLYDERRAIGNIRDQKKASADEMPSYPDAPTEEISASDLIKQQQVILARNGENQRKREQAESIAWKMKAASEEAVRLREQRDELQERLDAKLAEVEQLLADTEIARKTAEKLTDESTAEIEASLTEIDTINTKVRTNLAKQMAVDEAEQYGAQYDTLTDQIEQSRRDQLALLEGADLPLPGLSVIDGELAYNQVRWDGMSSSEQLRVATAIVRRLKPESSFVLVDKLEQFDIDTLREFGRWAESEQLQIIGTRVTTGEAGDATIIIEDGYGVGAITTESLSLANFAASQTWKAGEF